MSLLQNIVAQVVQNALKDNAPAQQPTEQAGGLGGLLGSVLGGAATQPTQNRSANNGFGLDDVLGSVLGSQLGSQNGNAGALGGLLGSVLGGQTQQKNVPASDLGGLLGGLLGGTAHQPRGGINKSTLLLALLPIVLGYIQKNGGLSGVLNKFNQNGLANKAQSFVNTGGNEPMSSDEIQHLFDQSEIQDICRQTGASEGEVCQGIAELLPQVMNELTPNGNVDDDENDANNEISEILQQFANAKH